MKNRTKRMIALILAICMSLVSLSAFAAESNGTFTIKGATVNSNVSAHDYPYYNWAAPVGSYLMENSDHTLTRVEYTGKVLVETYSPQNALLSTKQLEPELSWFGGFYGGKDYNFLVFGEINPNEKDSQEVIRVVKYSKSWARLGDCRIYGANTVQPFHSGLRMAEAAGKLYIHSSHIQYTLPMDGLRHQTNMTFVIDQAKMTVLEQECQMGDRWRYGYSSHSFNQFVETDGTYVFTVDHGDAYSRAVEINRTTVDDSDPWGTNIELLPIAGNIGDNATGVFVGGLALSKDNCLVVGNAVDFSTYGRPEWFMGSRNVFLIVADKGLSKVTTRYLTNFTGSVCRVGNPHITPLSGDRYLVLWEEYDQKGAAVTAVNSVLVDGDGRTVATNRYAGLRLSDCKPIATADGRVAWYYVSGRTATLCRIDPYNFPDVQDSSKWYFDYIKWGKEKAIINGSDNGTFKPDGTMNRASFVTMLWNIAGCPDPKGKSSFSDVKESDWYYKQVVWATEQGYVNGMGNGKFSPNGNMLRSQTVQIFYNMFQKAGDPKADLPFTDVKKGAWYYDAVAWATAAGVANGTSLTSFKPDKVLSRAEAITFIYNAWDLFQ